MSLKREFEGGGKAQKEEGNSNHLVKYEGKGGGRHRERERERLAPSGIFIVKVVGGTRQRQRPRSV